MLYLYVCYSEGLRRNVYEKICMKFLIAHLVAMKYIYNNGVFFTNKRKEEISTDVEPIERCELFRNDIYY